MHKGSSAPSYAAGGTLWCDDSTATLLGIKFYDGSDWILLYQIDVTNNRIVFPMAGVVDVASAGTTDLGAVTSNQVRITGTTTITGLGTAAAGTWRLIRFAGALTFTHNGTSLILPTSANITTAAGDTALVVSEGSGNWRCHWYNRANGKPLSSSVAYLDAENQAITGGGAITPKDLGEQTSGTLTLDMGDRPMQECENGGAFTLAPGTVQGQCTLDVVNNASAGGITTSGWTNVIGSFDTTDGNAFRCHCSVTTANGSLLIIQAMQ